MILILEDDERRVRQFMAAARSLSPPRQVVVWRSAPSMHAGLVDWLEEASLISLDHDLVPTADGVDPGSGYDIVKALAELAPWCPLIVHTSNVERGNWMVGELSRTAWHYERVYPYGDDWIARSWLPVARRLLGQA